MIQKSGADYAYIHFSFGPFLAFIRLWIECIILRPCIGAIQSLTFALYILKPFFPECDPPGDSVRILAAACLCLLCFINCTSVRAAAIVSKFYCLLLGVIYRRQTLFSIHCFLFKRIRSSYRNSILEENTFDVNNSTLGNHMSSLK